MEEEEELVERQQLQKKRRTEQLLTSGEVIKKIVRSQGIMLILENWEENDFYCLVSPTFYTQTYLQVSCKDCQLLVVEAKRRGELVSPLFYEHWGCLGGPEKPPLSM